MSVIDRIDNYLNKVKPNLNEGTWSSPNTVEKAKQLEKVMKNKITPKEADKKLYDLIGSDDFFDSLDDTFREEDQKSDIRWFIADWLEENWLSATGQKTFVKPWDPEALKMVKKITKKYKR